ncbi:MAG: peptidoglycan-binding protein [Nitriliruptoraceae bacterium]
MELIRRGQVGSEVEDIQRRLSELGFACADEPGRFGPATVASVRAFQQLRGLPADGIVGPDTWHALVGASFRLGDRLLYLTNPPLHGDDVRDLQRRLNRLGFDCGYDDGVYGDRTADALREFQLNVGVLVDGIAGTSTFALLANLHRAHQEAAASVVRERDDLRRRHRTSLAGTRILVDPAHSPDDPGVTAADGRTEHEVTWGIATRVEGRLIALGAHAVLSRGPHASPSPTQRAQLANREGVEAILSIHVNGAASPVARGVAAYHFGTDATISERGRVLAQLAADHVIERLGTADCRIHASTSALLRESRAPAAIVEVGFLTHPEEGAVLSAPAGQRRIGDALADALVAYLLDPPDATDEPSSAVSTAKT